MKKYYFIIFIALCCFFNLNAQIEGTWKLAPENGAIKIGPTFGSSEYFISNEQTILERPCYFDDTYVFNNDGSFINVLGAETWLETWQVDPAECGTPLAPYDGTMPATYSFDAFAGTIILNGTGAYLGFNFANNQGTLPDVSVPSSITYNFVLSENNGVMTISIQSNSDLFYSFKFIRDNVAYITDINFETYLETHDANGELVTIGDTASMGDGVLNNLTLKSKVEGITNLNVNDSNISSLQGIEAFTNLEILFCQRNQITNLDVSQNLALLELECESNPFTTLDVSNNTALKLLGCSDTNLSSIDVSNNLQLEVIWFTNNNISSLNLDVNTALRTYGLSNNPLVYMSIKNGNNSNIVYIEALDLPTLSCVQVDDENAATYISTNFNFIDENLLFSADCDTVYIPDANFETYLETHNTIGEIVALGDASSMGDGSLNNLVSKSKAELVTDLNVNDSNISSLQGIEAFTNLEILFCQRNQITNLDVSQNLALLELECESNPFTTLDVSNNTALKVLGCSDTNLSSIDVSNNLQLEAIWFTNNNISSLNLDVNTALRTYGLSNNPLVFMSIQNGNNASMSYIEAQNLPELTCIQVDDENASYLSQSNWVVDPSISFANDCGDIWTVYTTDTNLDTALNNYGTAIDSNGDGEITLNEAATFTDVLDLRNQGITEIQGLQAFTGVSEINLSGNSISDLTVLFGSSTVILRNRQAQFKTVANSNFSALKVLNINDNRLTDIDLSEITTLVELYCSNNLLNSLNVQNGNNAILTSFDASNNGNLSCIQIDSATDATAGTGSYSAWIKDIAAVYSVNCSSVLSIDNKENGTDISIFPNPVKDSMTLSAKQPIENIAIYNIIGQKVTSKRAIMNNRIDVSNLSKGMYILNVEIDGARKSIKFVKE